MSLDRDLSIISQNAGTTAANILGSLVAARVAAGETPTFDPDEYDAIRLHVFKGTLDLAGAEAVVEVFEGDAPAAPQATTSRPVFGTRSEGGGNSGNIEVKFGKHRGKTIQEIYEEDEGWLRWAAESANNDFIRKHAQKFLATAA